MSIADVIILFIVASALVAVSVKLWKQKKAGKGCCGDCSGCSGSCSARPGKHSQN